SRAGRSWWTDQLRRQQSRCVPPSRRLCGPDYKGQEAVRVAGDLADKISSSDQYQNCKVATHRYSRYRPEPCRRGDRMGRREFITLVGGGGGWPLAGESQQSPLPLIGFIGTGVAESTTAELKGFREGLSDSGYIDRRNVKIEYRWAEGQSSRSSALAADLVHDQVAVIAGTGNTLGLAPKAGTWTNPIVFQ